LRTDSLTCQEPDLPKTAVLIDHHPLWLNAVEQALTTASVEVVGRTTSLQEATELVERLQPDLVVLELAIREGEATGLTWLSGLSERGVQPKVIVLSSADEAASIEAALAAGASVYVIKKAHPEDVAVAVRQIYDRSLYLVGQEPIVERRPASTTSFGLTKREREILALAADGLSNNQIAKQLWVTEQTVKFHLSNIFTKLGVSNRTAASRLAQIHGLLSPTENESSGR
jgi:DNA-binding NarL/FixJ family response regulator